MFLLQGPTNTDSLTDQDGDLMVGARIYFSIHLPTPFVLLFCCPFSLVHECMTLLFCDSICSLYQYRGTRPFLLT